MRHDNTTNGDKTETESASMFRNHDVGSVITEFNSERTQYNTNKTRANRGGDWFASNNNSSKQPSQDGMEAVSEFCVKQHTGPRVVTETSLSYTAQNATPSVGACGSDVWLAHRRRRHINQDHGKHYNVLTGKEDQSRYDPSQNAKRVSVDKMLARQQDTDRAYNIISNK
ncbi:hypothetical protein HDU81_001508 [Chytriomyces hyalinus]|nr:hypothetical protein HDU81_001508 [Chytriomyces hyalinus]